MSAISDWVRYSAPDDFWTLTVVAILASAAGFIGGFYYLLRKRVMENVPTSLIRSAPQGYLELVGRGDVLEGPRTIAPLTGTPCTWYCFEIEERRGSGRRSRWATLEQGVSEDLFLLVDATGKCVIDPDGASVIPSVSHTWYGTTRRPRGGARTGGGFPGMGRYRYTEKRMHRNDPLYAIGLYRTVGGASGDFDLNDDLLALLREWKADAESLLKRHDRNKDGVIDLIEWEHVREAALKEVMANHRELREAPPVNIMGQTRDPRRPYILSAKPQEIMIRRYQYYTWGLLALFFLAGAAAAWMIGLRYQGL